MKMTTGMIGTKKMKKALSLFTNLNA